MGDPEPELSRPELIAKIRSHWDPPPEFILPHLDDELAREFAKIELDAAAQFHRISLDRIEKSQGLIARQPR